MTTEKPIRVGGDVRVTGGRHTGLVGTLQKWTEHSAFIELHDPIAAEGDYSTVRFIWVWHDQVEAV
jgi:hypothetical protein